MEQQNIDGSHGWITERGALDTWLKEEFSGVGEKADGPWQQQGNRCENRERESANDRPRAFTHAKCQSHAVGDGKHEGNEPGKWQHRHQCRKKKSGTCRTPEGTATTNNTNN